MTAARGEEESGGLAPLAHAGHADGSAVVPAGIRGVPAVPVCCAGQHPVVIDGDLLRETRRDAGLSRERLARAAEVSITTISRLERESRPGCYLGTCNKIAVVLGLGLQEIIVCGSQVRPRDPMASRPGPQGASATEDRKRCGSS